jgi:A/G-specific adenine glycosylase
MQDAIGRWYVETHRDLPWRRGRDPYATWLSETMLQQTRAQTVVAYFERFLRELPTVHALAEAPLDRVLALWSGLGYYRRARMLHAAARTVVANFDGRVPSELHELRQLPGVGRYTAGAIASIAYGRRTAVVDGNVSRLLARVFGVDDDVGSARGAAQIWSLADQLVAPPGIDPGVVNQGMMELGATVCLPRAPRCQDCPLCAACVARATGQAGQWPKTSSKRPSMTVRRSALVLASQRFVVLARRKLTGLFGGLWEPPSTEGEASTLAHALQVPPDRLRSVGLVQHVLSHRRMRVEVFVGPLGRRRTFVQDCQDYEAVEAKEWSALPSLPQSALTRKVLKLATPGLGSLR